MKKAYSIEINDLTLTYELYYDRTNNLKEFVINKLTGKKYVDKAFDNLDALSKINLNIFEGERVGIIGHNGAGKSTLLKVISGILKPTSGKIKINGNVQPLIEIGAGFDPEFTGRENIYLNSYMLGFNKAQITEKEQAIIDFADLGNFIDKPIKYYSSGMTVRLAFSIATMIEPEILVFDEMLAAGDQNFITKAKKRTAELVDTAKIMLVVSHDLKLIESMCTRCILLNKGRIILDSTPQEAIQKYLEASK